MKGNILLRSNLEFKVPMKQKPVHGFTIQALPTTWSDYPDEGKTSALERLK